MGSQLSEGILLLDKPSGITSFKLVSILRKKTGVKKIGHAGTLDPLATGLMVLLVGRSFTKLSQNFLGEDKEYLATFELGKSTSTYDGEGEVKETSDYIPSIEEIDKVLEAFQGKQTQVPPMFSAKKVAGRRLYDLARQGKEVERLPQEVEIRIELLSYVYPDLSVKVACSKGTYIRSLAYDIGKFLGTFAYLKSLRRTRSGTFSIEQASSLEELEKGGLPFLS